MRILLVHNTYQQKGGEDSVFENEYQLLLKNNNMVGKLLFNNDAINSTFDKLKVGLNSIYNSNSSEILRNKIISFKPDIIHVHNFFPIASPSIFYVADELNIPIVMTLHNYRLICPNALLFRENEICEKCINKDFAIDGVLNGCYRDSKVQTFALAFMSYVHKKKKTWQTKVSKYIALTHFAKEKVLSSSLGLDANQIVVKPNFVEDFGFDYDKEDYFLFVGRLSVEKGIHLLLNAFKGSDKVLFIIGSGPLEEEVNRVALSHPNIVYLGFKDKEFIIQKLQKARALVFSSIWYETFGMTIIESFSVGTPVIGANIGSPNEIIKNNHNGLIYKVNDLESLKEKIELMSNNEINYYKLCENARLSYESNYTEEKNYQFMMDIYQKIIDEKTAYN